MYLANFNLACFTGVRATHSLLCADACTESLEKALSYMNKLEHTYSQTSARWRKNFVNLNRITGKAHVEYLKKKEEEIEK